MYIDILSVLVSTVLERLDLSDHSKKKKWKISGHLFGQRKVTSEALHEVKQKHGVAERGKKKKYRL